MAVELNTLKNEDPMAKLVADRPLYAATDWSRLLDDDELKSGHVVAARAGKVIDPVLVSKLSLVEEKGRVVQAKAEKAPAKNKERKESKDKAKAEKAPAKS